jgi:hypothetical protein
MDSDKISGPLAESLQDPATGDWLDVIVELGEPAAEDAPAGSRAVKIAARKEAFARQAEPVAARIRGLGGEVTGQAWINGTLRVRLGKHAVPTLSQDSGIARIDLPHILKADAS